MRLSDKTVVIDSDPEIMRRPIVAAFPPSSKEHKRGGLLLGRLAGGNEKRSIGRLNAGSLESDEYFSCVASRRNNLSRAKHGLSYLIQIPIETEVPGEPFLLFFAVVVGCTLVFGRITGFLAVAVSSLLSLHFFEPGGSINIYHASDLIKVELYALFSAGAVVLVSGLNTALLATQQAALLLANKESQKSVLLAELAHRVANNFAGARSAYSTEVEFSR